MKLSSKKKQKIYILNIVYNLKKNAMLTINLKGTLVIKTLERKFKKNYVGLCCLTNRGHGTYFGLMGIERSHKF